MSHGRKRTVAISTAVAMVAATAVAFASGWLTTSTVDSGTVTAASVNMALTGVTTTGADVAPTDRWLSSVTGFGRIIMAALWTFSANPSRSMAAISRSLA